MPLSEATANRIGQLLNVNVHRTERTGERGAPVPQGVPRAIVNVSSTFGHRPAAPPPAKTAFR
jgi:hypothetical protein